MTYDDWKSHDADGESAARCADWINKHWDRLVLEFLAEMKRKYPSNWECSSVADVREDDVQEYGEKQYDAECRENRSRT